MNPAVYKEKRDTLLDILDRICQIDGIDPRYQTEFVTTRRKCLENQFNIALVGEFQGGKSTTFNTFCDGREISPRGAMVKTSACRLTAQNLSDPDKAEYAVVNWKTPYELIIGFIDLIKSYFLDDPKLKDRFTTLNDAGKPTPMNSTELAMELKLDERRDRTLIQTALNEQWKIYTQNKNDFDEEKLDLLYISLLVINFYDSASIKSLRGNTNLSIDKIQKLITFPKDWNHRWGKGDPAAFSAEETAFCFIGSITCMIHSPNLERLGCTVTDCPGLFASPWDTAVAENAMRDADAILYLMGGIKAMQLQETKILKRIRQINMANKLFFAVNMRSNKAIVKSNIIPANIGTLNSIGFTLTADEIKIYQAFLAFASAFGKQYLNGTLDERSKESFLSLSKDLGGASEQSSDKSWTGLVQQALGALGVSFEEIIKLGNLITPEYVEAAARYSEMAALLDDIEKYILDHKAYSILVPNGVDRAIDSLIKIKADLQQKEDDAELEKSQAEAEAQIAQNNLAEFQKQAYEIIEKSFQPGVYALLKHNFYNNVLLASIDMVSTDAAIQIERRLKHRYDLLIKQAGQRNLEIREIVEPEMAQAINQNVTSLSASWIVNIKDNSDNVSEAYDNSIIREITRINEQLDRKWEALKTTKRLEGLTITLPSGNPIDDKSIFEAFQRSGSPAGAIDDFWSPIGKSMIRGILLRIAAFPFTALFESVNRTWAVIRDLFNIKGEDIFENPQPAETGMSSDAKAIKEKIVNQLNSFFNKTEEREKLEAQILAYLQEIGRQYQTTYRQILEEQKATLQKNLGESMERFNMQFERRKKIAADAHALRVEKITPSLDEATAFRKTVIELTGDNAK